MKKGQKEIILAFVFLGLLLLKKNVSMNERHPLEDLNTKQTTQIEVNK